MKFNVNVVKNTEHLTWVYDTENNHVYDEHGELVNPAVIENGFNLGEAYTETSNPNKKKLDSLRLFEVLLGFNCNFNCEYCGQKDYVDVVPSASPKDVLQFVEKIKSLNIPAPGRVAFWGGEPLVYWKVLEVLIPALRELWPTSYSNIITNGSLLTKEKIDFLKKYQIAMTVSYDCVDDTHRLVNIGKAFVCFPG